ncbi:10315_t:CDS:2 [Funneliformis geosporum]|nr:10315_t:CDS:2 [Funneliformis geosporum]
MEKNNRGTFTDITNESLLEELGKRLRESRIKRYGEKPMMLFVGDVYEERTIRLDLESLVIEKGNTKEQLHKKLKEYTTAELVAELCGMEKNNIKELITKYVNEPCLVCRKIDKGECRCHKPEVAKDIINNAVKMYEEHRLKDICGRCRGKQEEQEHRAEHLKQKEPFRFEVKNHSDCAVIRTEKVRGSKSKVLVNDKRCSDCLLRIAGDPVFSERLRKDIDSECRDLERLGRINKKKDVLSDYRERFEKGEVDLKELREIEEIVREGLQDLDQLLARAKAAEVQVSEALFHKNKGHSLKIVQGRIKAIEAYIEKEGETGYSDHSHYPSQVIFENLKLLVGMSVIILALGVYYWLREKRIKKLDGELEKFLGNSDYQRLITAPPSKCLECGECAIESSGCCSNCVNSVENLESVSTEIHCQEHNHNHQHHHHPKQGGEKGLLSLVLFPLIGGIITVVLICAVKA